MRIVGIGVARTRAVDVLAMRSWYHPSMAETTDSDLQAAAENDLHAALDLLGYQIDGLYHVGGDDYWDALVERGRKALERTKKAAPIVAKQAARKIGSAAQRGLDAASSATAPVRAHLAELAATAVVTGAGITLLSNPALVAMLLLALGWAMESREGRQEKRRAAFEAAGF